LFGLVDEALVGDRGDEFGVTLVNQLVGDVWMHGALLGCVLALDLQARFVSPLGFRMQGDA
jgi:hypothetical protein